MRLRTIFLTALGAVAESARDGSTGEPVWDVLTRYLRDRKVIRPGKLNLPRLIGVSGNRGIA